VCAVPSRMTASTSNRTRVKASSPPKVAPVAIRPTFGRVVSGLWCPDLHVLPRRRRARSGPRSEEVGDDARRRPFSFGQSLERLAATPPRVGARRLPGSSWNFGDDPHGLMVTR
jgi:hypothetical protein